MMISSGNRDYRITRNPSIYTSRAGKEDCRIMVESDFTHGGARYGDKLFRTIAVYAAESGTMIRSYERLPNEITMPLLHQWGMIEFPKES